MWKQIRLLSNVTLCNTFGINEARFCKDKKKKNRLVLLAFTFLFLSMLCVTYIGGSVYMYIQLGVSDAIPSYLLTLTSLIILAFSMFKAGSIIFNMKTYEEVICLPLKPSVIVISRFYTMYVFNMALSLLVLVPGAVVYGVHIHPQLSFYIMMLLGAFLLPLIPMTIATVIGAVIYGISSRMRHKNVAVIILSLAATLVLLFAPTLLASNSTDMGELQFVQLSSMLADMLENVYPPAALFSDGVLNCDIISYLIFAGVSIGVFALFVLIIKKFFVSICTSLHSSLAKRNYVMKTQEQASVLKALYRKDLKRYFSASIYVLNTSIGYILMILFAVFVLISGVESITSILPVKGMVDKLFPMLISIVCVISPPSTSSVSIEGKQWWIAKSLPVSTKTLFDAKLLVTLTIALPCYVITEILLLIALPLSFPETVWLIILPLLYIMFSDVLGLTINAHMPMFNWESEAVAVKQSGAVLIAMLVCFISAGAPIAAIALLPAISVNLIYLATSIIIALATIIMYGSNNRMRIIKIG